MLRHYRIELRPAVRLMSDCPCTCPTPGSRAGAGYAPAFICATSAGLRTLLAVLRLVFGAFICASLAHLCAQMAYSGDELAAARHIGCCQAADLRAIHIQSNTARHHFYIVFLQAGGGAVIANIRTDITRFNTGFILLMSHGILH